MNGLIVPVDSALNATLPIGTPAFPFARFHDDLECYSRGFVNWHRQKTIEISCVVEGAVRVCLLNEEHRLHAGEAFVLLPGAIHSIQPVGELHARYFTFIFDPCLLCGHAGSFFEQEYYAPVRGANVFYYSFDAPAVLEALHALCAETDGPADRLRIQRMLQDIWIALCATVFDRTPGPEPGEKEARIWRMLRYLHANYAEKFSLTQMAEQLHVSRGECCRFFHRMMGMTISEYLLDYRMRQATELLRTNSSITEIAHLVGFRSSSNFTAEFRKKTGLTPTQWRAAQKDS